MALFWYLIPVAIYAFYKWFTLNFDFFEKQGILSEKFYAGFRLLFVVKPFVESFQETYDKYEGEKVYGGFELRRPIPVIRDPKLAKQLAVKEFDHFTDHRVIVDSSIDPMLGRALVSLKGQKWKDMRATLSPAFTGSKMRQMFEFIREVGHQTADTMSEDIKAGKESAFEFKALAMKFTVDVIASSAFGIEVNSFKDPENEFYKIATKITNFNMTKQLLKSFAFMIFPKLMKWLGITIFDKEVNPFIREATIETMRIREEKGIVRHDMINLLMQARKGQLATNNNDNEKITEGFATVEESQLGKSEVTRVWDDDDLAAQCFIFFLAGFDTVATTMSYMAYELMVNPEIQQKLFEEILEKHNELDGNKITYEQIQGLKYLDQVISETLRKWPVAIILDRECGKDFDLHFDNKTLHFTKGMNFFIPMHCFHNDAKYFPNPNLFDPDRFNEENRKNIDPDTYLPFGLGPRNCIGSRFALMELKTIFYNLLLKFSFEVSEKTKVPFEWEKVPLGMRPNGGIWVTLKPRDL